MHTWLLVAAEQAGSLTVRWGMLFLDPDMLFPSLCPLAVNSEANYTDSGAPARLPAPLCLHWCDVGFVSVCDRKRAMNPPPYGCVRLRGARTVEESWRSCGRAREEKLTATVLPDDVHDTGGEKTAIGRMWRHEHPHTHYTHTHLTSKHKQCSVEVGWGYVLSVAVRFSTTASKKYVLLCCARFAPFIENLSLTQSIIAKLQCTIKSS